MRATRALRLGVRVLWGRWPIFSPTGTLRSLSTMANHEWLAIGVIHDCQMKIRRLKIIYDPSKEVLYFPNPLPVYNSGCTDWLAEVLCPCHEKICDRSRSDKEHFNPLRWLQGPVDDCIIKSLEMAGAISAYVGGTMFHPSLGVVLSNGRCELMLKLFKQRLFTTSGMDLFSVPVKSAEYGALEWGHDSADIKMDVTLSMTRFMNGAKAHGLTDADAALQLVNDLNQELRPGIVLSRFLVCQSDICWFIPMTKAIKLLELSSPWAKLPALKTLLQELALPESEISETCEVATAYTIEIISRSVVISVTPAVEFDPNRWVPPIYRELMLNRPDKQQVLLYKYPEEQFKVFEKSELFKRLLKKPETAHKETSQIDQTSETESQSMPPRGCLPQRYQTSERQMYSESPSESQSMPPLAQMDQTSERQMYFDSQGVPPRETSESQSTLGGLRETSKRQMYSESQSVPPLAQMDQTSESQMYSESQDKPPLARMDQTSGSESNGKPPLPEQMVPLETFEIHSVPSRR